MTEKQIAVLFQMEQEEGADRETENLPQVFNPWRRFFARGLDLFLCEICWAAFLAFVFHINLTTRNSWGHLFDSFMAIAVMLVLEPLWLYLFGTTPGKMILGLRVKGADGGHLPYHIGWKRTWGVIGSGLGYNIPAYHLWRLWKSYKICRDNKTEPWDESIAYTVRDTKRYRNAVYIGVCAAASFVLIMIFSAQLLPPNRGELTVPQYVENYNYYADYLGINFGNEFLNEDGKWAEKPSYGTSYIELDEETLPDYSFTVENGYIKSVTFQVELKNNNKWLYTYDKQMILASLSLIGAQNETGLFSQIPAQIEGQIKKHHFQNFSFMEAGLTVNCVTEYSGYNDTKSGFLLPAGKDSENYYSLTFSVSQ